MKPLFVLIVMIFSTSACLGVEEDRVLAGDMSIGKQYLFASKILGAEQRYRVLLPMSYERNPTARYPVLYVLDGGHTFATLTYSTMISQYGFGTKVPEAIIVAVRSSNRFRDYTGLHSSIGYDGKNAPYLQVSGGGATYRMFLEQELIPHIETHYRSNGFKALLGHSIGGYFALYDLLSREPVFNSYLAVDPSLWFGNGHLTEQLKELRKQNLPLHGKAYISVALSGLKSDDADVVAYQRTKLPRVEAIEDFIKASETAFRVQVDVFPDEHHGSVVPISFLNGLRFIFKGYEPPAPENIAFDPSMLLEHFSNFSEQAGAEFVPDYRTVTDAAMVATGENQIENATYLFEMNARNFPKSERILMQLAQHYETRNWREKALNTYRNLLELSSANVDIKKKINELEKPGRSRPND